MFEFRQTRKIARITINRPASRNAIPLDGWSQLCGQVQAAVATGAHVLVLSGAGGAFCAGADIDDFAVFRDDASARADFRIAMRAGLECLRDSPLPIVAAIDGPCYGAGVALAMACDIRIAGAAARFAITPAKLGIAYPQEDVHRLVRLVGPGQAARLLYGGNPISAAEAARIGLVEIYRADGLAGAVEDIAETIAANDIESLRALKRAVALAELGERSSPVQDSAFDALLGSDALAGRLEARASRR